MKTAHKNGYFLLAGCAELGEEASAAGQFSQLKLEPPKLLL